MGSRDIKVSISHWLKLERLIMLLRLSITPNFYPLFLPHFWRDLFRTFRDGRPLEGLPSPIKTFPKIASVIPLF